MPDIEQRIRAHIENLEAPRPDPRLPQRLTRSIRRRRAAQVAGGALAVVAIAGAGGLLGTQLADDAADEEPPASATPTTPPLTEAQARRYIVEVLSEPNVDPIASYADDATDYLPNRLFAVGNQPAATLSDRVVVATITGVEEGEAYTAHNDPVDDWHDQDFYGYKTAILHLEAVPLVGNDPPQTITASLRLSSSDTLETWKTGLTSYSPVVVFLTNGSEFDTADHTFAGDGVTMLPIGDDGTLTAPFRPHWLKEVDTLDELRAEARRPPITEHVPPGGGSA